ncbi:DsbE family thiol:disulfide interchange protein [Rhodobacteraceae bacterium CCMM004]|nr:DsbE family thiol:disulfide interchange protein [Rhodobacteraceae bacterium CCMM004]
MARISPLMLAPPVLFALLAVLFYTGMQREDPDALPSAMVGREVPALTVTDLSGPAFTVADLAAPGVKLVNFWASWCAPCRVEHPNLQLLADEGVPIYGINYKDEPAKALAFLRELGDPYVGLAADESGRTGLDWGLYGVPETFVVDGAGKVVLRFAGPITERSLEGQIRPAIAQAQAGG